MDPYAIFDPIDAATFDAHALAQFQFHYQNNTVYRQFCAHLKRTENHVKNVCDIPFLPIEFFKSKTIVSNSQKPQVLFTSSGTTGSTTSTHYVTDIGLYERSYLEAFQYFYGPASDYCILALLPSYLEREGSSLIYMVQDLIQKSSHPDSGFYLHDVDALQQKILKLEALGTKTLLIGVSFALLDLVEKFRFNLKYTTVMETGGMKGKRKEMIRTALHERLREGFGVEVIHSEYGMTELLSQAYSKGHGIFETPPWMRIYIRDTEDPLTYQAHGKTGGVNIIDLANHNSCPFIATQDLGKCYKNGHFEILGRFDHSDIRGCNLMAL
ncbi:LuxE/PaaK family acyltransferase [Spongiimicrobium salis]|uniref:LuxE/PaaK family acyltransferase n=1 Tax=Spongiimicrobium salis TaxID=1667022 RepID=UPI00374DE49B